MGTKQFLGVKWADNIPKLVFYDNIEKKYSSNECKGNIEIKKTPKRICKGYYDLTKEEMVPCECFKELTDTSYSQCLDCQSKSGFELCLGCTGDYCRNTNRKAKEFCIQDHYVYLAYFANDKLKVGTAAGYRKTERLLEQGALFSLFIAKVPTGQLARVIENKVSQLGITTRVNISYKMSNFIIDRDVTEIKKMLLNEYDVISRSVGSLCKQYLIDPIFNDFSEISNIIRCRLLEESQQLDLFGGMSGPEHKDYRIVAKPELINGNIAAVVGSLILLENQSGFSVLNMKYLEGWMVELK